MSAVVHMDQTGYQRWDYFFLIYHPKATLEISFTSKSVLRLGNIFHIFQETHVARCQASNTAQCFLCNVNNFSSETTNSFVGLKEAEKPTSDYILPIIQKMDHKEKIIWSKLNINISPTLKWQGLLLQIWKLKNVPKSWDLPGRRPLNKSFTAVTSNTQNVHNLGNLLISPLSSITVKGCPCMTTT